MKITTLPAFVLGFALLASACGEASDPAPPTSPVGTTPVTTSPVGSDADFLAGTEWVATSLSLPGSDQVAVTDDSPPTMRFNDIAAEVSGWTTCNSYGASVIVGSGSIAFGDLFATEAACADPDLMQRESTVLAIIAGASRFVFADAELTISGDEGSITFEMPLPVVDVALDDTLWTLDTLINGEAASSVLSTTRPTMTIDTTSGSIRGTTGCNDYFGEIRVEDTVVAITGLGWTEIGCERPVMRQEAAILEVLQTAESLTIEGDTLTLLGAEGRALVFRAG